MDFLAIDLRDQRASTQSGDGGGTTVCHVNDPGVGVHIGAYLRSQPRMRCSTRGDEFGRDARGVIDRYGETEADRTAFGIVSVTETAQRRCRRVHSDEVTVHVNQGAPRVTRVECGI